MCGAVVEVAAADVACAAAVGDGGDDAGFDDGGPSVLRRSLL